MLLVASAARLSLSTVSAGGAGQRRKEKRQPAFCLGSERTISAFYGMLYGWIAGTPCGRSLRVNMRIFQASPSRT